jgi:hypothetical protein
VARRGGGGRFGRRARALRANVAGGHTLLPFRATAKASG